MNWYAIMRVTLKAGDDNYPADTVVQVVRATPIDAQKCADKWERKTGGTYYICGPLEVE